MIYVALLLITFIFFFLKLIICIACSLVNSQNFFMQSLPLHTSCLLSMLLNDDIVNKNQMEYVYFYIHQYFLLNIQDYAKIKNGALMFKNIIFQKALQRLKNLYFHIIFYEIHVCFLLQINERNSNNCDI